MTVVVKSKEALVVPPSVRRKAGFKAGDRLEFKVSGGVVSIVPKVVATDEYTAAQRRAVSARLDTAERGQFYGPFSPKEAGAFLKRSVKATQSPKPTRAR